MRSEGRTNLFERPLFEQAERQPSNVELVQGGQHRIEVAAFWKQRLETRDELKRQPVLVERRQCWPVHQMPGTSRKRTWRA
jgi:hypothetical protein